MFRATVTGFSDQFSPSWNAQKIMGRADSVHLYDSWARSISFNFKVAATSRDEMKPNWRKLNYLSSWTAPKYKGADGYAYQPPFIRFTLGNLFQETPCFINSLTYSVSEDTPWEINLENDPNNLQLPMYVDVQMSLTMIMDYRPQWNGRMYSLSERGTSGDTDANGGNWLYDSSVEPTKKTT